MENNIITFVIVTWNSSDTIIPCLDSIYKYCQNFEIIVIDNNSSDDTANIIKEKKYSNCKVIELKENVGFAAGNNIPLKDINTEYLCYLNPDTILIEDIIIPSIEVIKKDKNVGLVGCKLLNKDLSLQASTFNFINHNQIYFEAFRVGKILPKFISEKFFPNESKSLKSKCVDWVIGAEMILKTEDAKKINGFSTEYYMYTEDMDLCKKINKQLNKKIYYLSNVSLIHIGGVSESKNTNYKKMEKIIRNKIKFSEKFYEKKETKKIKKALYNSYKIRMNLVKIFYHFDNENRKKYIEKMKSGLEITKKILEEN